MFGDGDSYTDRRKALFAVQVVFLFLAWIFCCLRAYVKVFMLKRITVDDHFMLFSVLVYTAYGVIAAMGPAYGMSTDNLTPEGASFGLRSWFFCEVLYPPMSATIRTSIALFLLRIATQTSHRRVIYANITVVWVVSLIYFFIMVFQCTPVTYFWMQPFDGEEGWCVDKRVAPASTVVHSVVSALCDWCLGVLPVFMLWEVQMNRRTKVTIVLLLSMGIIAGAALIVRIPYLKAIPVSIDFLYQTIDVAIWSVMEPSLGIIAGCAVTLRPLFKRWGFGPNTAAPVVQPGSPGRSGAGWFGRPSRRRQEKNNITAGNARVAARPSGFVSTQRGSSDIELNRAGSRSGSADDDDGLRPWEVGLDVEHGRGKSPGESEGENRPLPPTGISVNTSISVISQQRRPGLGHVDSAASLPLEAGHVVCIRGSK